MAGEWGNFRLRFRNQPLSDMSLAAAQPTDIVSGKPNKRWRVLGMALGAAALSVGVFWGATAWFGGRSAAYDPAAFHRIVPMNLTVAVQKDGELQATNNIEISCRVEGTTTIQQIVKEGASVKKGDVLVILDSAAIKQKLEDTLLDLQKAEADLTTSREMLEIQRSQNNANLQAAEVELVLAQLDLQQYIEGTYPQQLQNARTELEMAGITLKSKQEDLAQTRSLFAKGFETAIGIKNDELEVTTAENGLQKAKTALRVLEQYTHQMDLTSKKNAVAQAEQHLSRVKRENASNLSQKEADVRAKEQSLALLRRRYARYEEQFAACTIEAPADGMVVYSSSSERNNQNPIQEGTQVRERQSLLKLPDTSEMKAVIRIQESQVPRLHIGQRAIVKIVGVPYPLGATLTRISVLADSSNRWWNPDLREYPVDLTLDDTPAGLKPGIGVQAEIIIDQFAQTLATPVSSIYTAGADTYTFVRTPDGVRPQKIQVGAANETHVQILDGLAEGAEVQVLQPGQGRMLLEQAGIQITPVAPGNDALHRPEAPAEAKTVEPRTPTPPKTADAG